ncbi:TPA: hypothetical protein DEX28_01425 [Patescibacteria group bacterium]|nr:hypothetical protein [Patescibacteria group bacterium]
MKVFHKIFFISSLSVKNLVFFLLLSTFYFLLSTPIVFAADFVLVDWAAQSFSPENYSFYAKNPAIPGSTVKLTVNFFSDSGRGQYVPVDLKNYTIRWFNGAVKIAELKGTKTLSYEIGKFGQESSLNLSVQVLDGSLNPVGSKQVVIPIKKSPELTMHLVENGKVSSYHQDNETFRGVSGQELEIQVKPYFFNVKNIFDLNFEWSHRLQKIDNSEENKYVFKAKLPQNKISDLFSVFVQNSKSELEFVKKNFYLSNK